MNVTSNSAIDVTACGLRALSGITGRPGGSYGGRGSNYNGKSGPTYGDVRRPVDLGSGGFGSSDRSTRGGGYLHIVTTSLMLEGSLLANGQSHLEYTGGGSGGSILLDVATLTGGGIIRANGGIAGANGAGHGGGGRVAVYYQNITGFTSSDIEAKASGSAEWGTVYLAGPRRVSVNNIGPGHTLPVGPVVIAYMATNTFSFYPDPTFEVQKIFADGIKVAETVAQYDWINTGVMRGEMNDSLWAQRLQGSQLDVVFLLPIVSVVHNGTTLTIKVMGSAQWLYTLLWTDELFGDVTWQVVPGQEDVLCAEGGILTLTAPTDKSYVFYQVTGCPSP